MSTKSKKFLSRLNPETYKFGTKINMMVFTILFVALIVTSGTGYYFVRKSLIQTNYERLKDLGSIKKQDLDKELGKFRQEVQELSSSPEFVGKISELKNAFQNYSLENRSAFFNIDAFRSQLTDFYKYQALKNFSYDQPDFESVFPDDDQAIIMQVSYLANNPFPFGKKVNLSQVDDFTGYATIHGYYHSDFRALAEKFNMSNIYLVDPATGKVFYTLEKNFVFGTSLHTGRFNKTSLATAFKKVAASPDQKFFALEDYSFFIPSFQQPVCFMAVPVTDFDEKVAVLVVELSSKFFEAILYDQWALRNEKSIEYTLIGTDLKLRNRTRQELNDSRNFFDELRDSKQDTNLIYKVDGLQTTVMTYGYSQKDEEKLALTHELLEIKDYKKDEVLAYSVPFMVGGINWMLVTKINKSEAMSYTRLAFLTFLIIAIVLLALVIFTNRAFRNSIVRRLEQLRDSMTHLYAGKHTGDIEVNTNDELDETILLYNKLRSRINEAGEFAVYLSEENYKAEFKAMGENDQLASSLRLLKDQLKKNQDENEKRRKVDEIQKWINDGIAKFNDLLRQSNDNILTLSYLIIENLVEYLEANQGGIYMDEGEDDTKKEIRLTAGFAYDRRKYNQKTIEIGEGLIGTCFLEKKPILLKDIPEDYIEITSGLGKATPRNLYIVPLIIDKIVLGFIEIASFSYFEEHHIDFIQRVSNNIGATFKTVMLNSRTAELLEESKKRANEIAQQEEEMRQNLEEMQATQEELARLREEDEKQTRKLQLQIDSSKKVLNALADTIGGEVLLKDQNGVVVLANELAAEQYKLSSEEILGKTAVDFMTPENAEKENKLDEKALKSGEFSIDETVEVGENTVIFKITKKPFDVDFGNTGVLTIRKRIS